MNTPGLFIMGAVVTLIVALALGLLLYGAVLDGREQRRRERSLRQRRPASSGRAATDPDG